MPKYTDNLNLILPDVTESYDVNVANTNNTEIDKQIANKIDKIVGKGLSTNDFTDGYKKKLDNLENYDDTDLKSTIEDIKNKNTSQDEEIKNLETKNSQQDAEIEALKSENTLLKSQIPSATVVGETIHLEDSSNMQCQISPLGASKQETREGYNLVDFSADTEHSFINDILTITSSAAYSGSRFDILDIIKNNVGKTLYFSCESFDFSNSNKGNVQINYTLNGTVYYNTILTNSGEYEGLVITEEMANCTSAILRIYCNNSEITGTEYTTVITKPMLAFEENLPYEQYGASPSIEHEAPIESVGDNIQLLDESLLTNQTIVGVEVKRENGIITLNGTATGSATVCIPITLPKGTYCFGYFGKHKNPIFTLRDSSKAWISNLIGSTSPNTIITVEEETTYNIAINITSGVTYTPEDTAFTMKISKGTSTGAYSPYGQGSIEICNRNKNIPELKEIEETTQNGITYSVKNGCVKAKGICTADFEVYINKENFELKIGEKYTISGGLETFTEHNGQNRYVRLGVANTGMPYGNCNATPNKTFEVPQNNASTYRIVLSFYAETGKEVDFKIYPMLEKGSTATKYLKHQSQTKAIYTQQPFRSIGKVKDRFVKVDGVWYEEHNFLSTLIGKQGTWVSNTNNYAVYVNGPDYGTYDDSKSPPVSSTRFKYVTGVEPNNLKEGEMWYQTLSNNSSFKYIYFGVDKTKDYAITADKFKEWLLTNNVRVNYVLAEPLLIPCTPEQVEVLESFNTYKNVTNISSDSTGELEVFYYKDIETLNKNNEERILALENIIATLQSATVEEET